MSQKTSGALERQLKSLKRKYVIRVNKLEQMINWGGPDEIERAKRERDKILISRYANDNLSEFIAEFFVMVRRGPKEKITPFTQKVYDLITGERTK